MIDDNARVVLSGALAVFHTDAALVLAVAMAPGTGVRHILWRGRSETLQVRKGARTCAIPEAGPEDI